MDTNQLLVTIDLEDYDAGLTGKLSVDGFSGFGEGCFNLSDVRAKKGVAEAFCCRVPKESDNAPSHEELLNDNAARLKAELKTGRNTA